MSINMSVQSVLDSIESAQKSNIIPDQEFVLQGSVLDLSVNVLLSRLRGLCDNADQLPQTFHDQEICFVLKDFSGSSITPGAAGGIMLRVRRALDHTDMPWQLRYTGQPEVGSRPALLRNCLDVPVSSNICDFLHELGAKVDHEFVSKGYILRKGRIKVTVFKIFKVSGGGNVSKEGVEGLSKSHVVELSALTTRVDEAVAVDLRILADQLKPLVNLQNLDYRRL